MSFNNHLNQWLDFAKTCPEEFTVQYPPSPDFFRSNFKVDPKNVAETFSECEELLLYLHVPFCKQKCSFCNFAIDVSTNKYDSYTNALCVDLDKNQDLIKRSKISGIDIGGGTPTLLDKEQLKRIFNKIEYLTTQSTDPNFSSIETTPHIASSDFDKMQIISDYNIKRISMGIQSSDSEVLSSVKRAFVSDNQKAMDNFNKAGFSRINIDLIFGLPSQSLTTWQIDIEHAISLSPTSITIYDCLYSRQGRTFHSSIKVPSMETYGEMYDLGYNVLHSYGYTADYGSLNFSKIHGETGTSKYFKKRMLQGKSYLGLGNYATSLHQNIWYFNTFNSANYIDRVNSSTNTIDDYYILPVEEIMAKLILTSLNYGIIDKTTIFNRIGIQIDAVFKNEVEYLLEQEWMYLEDQILKLKYGNFKNLNYIRSLFYTDKAKDWMRLNLS